MPATAALRLKVSALCQYSGCPFQSRNCLAVPPVAAAMRDPRPAASSSAQGRREGAGPSGAGGEGCAMCSGNMIVSTMFTQTGVGL